MALSNLVKNAIEASPKDEKIQLSFEESRNGCLISIQNKGEVPTTIRERFFEKNITDGKTHGTGLGTYIARKAISTQGGDIFLDTTRRGSTVVIIKLPKERYG